MRFRERPRIVVATLVAAVFACAWAASGAVRVDVLSSAKDAAPGEVVTHVFAVTHDGVAAETFALAVDSPAGWTVLGVPPEITVAPGEEGVVFVTLAVPPDAAAGSYALTLHATAIADPTDGASAGIATRVAAVNRIELTPPGGQSLPPGGSASYSVIVTNLGNAQDVVAVAATSSRGYAADGSVTSLELSPRESREVVVRLTVPADAGPGRDVLTVRATSTLYAGVEGRTAIFTTILPPGPGAVGGSLYEVLPTRISLEIERNETTGAFDSQASLSISGPVFDGTFAASATALHPFGSGPVDVTTYSLSYRLERASFAIGNVSQALSDLHSISCDGGSTSIDADFIDIALIAGGSGDETRFGGRLDVGPEEAQLGLAYSDRRSETSRSAAWTGLASAEPIDGWILRAEGGLGTIDGYQGRAGFFGTTIDGDSYFLSASAFSIDTYFPGPRNDSAGVEASQRLRLAALSLGLSFGHTWNNVVRDPLASTLVTDSLGVNVSATPWEEGPTLQGTITFKRNHQADGTPRDDVDSLLAYSVADAGEVFPYAFTGRIADRMDLLLGTRERTLTHTQEVGLSIDGLTVLLRLSEEQVVDLAHDLVLSSAGSAALVVRPGDTPHEASIEFRSVGDRLDLKASFVLHASEDLSFSLGGFAEWERGNPSAAAFGWSIGVDATLGVPLPFLVTKGRIDGRVFVDRNANGVFDEGEPPAADAVVFVEEGEVSTNAQGEYRFPPLAPRQYSLQVRELPRDAAFQGPITVTLAPGEEFTVDVPLAPILTVRGAVFDDANQDGVRQAQETGFPGIRVLLSGGDGATVTTATDARGEFVFASARPGTYVVSLDTGTLPERFSFTTRESQTVDAASASSVLFGGFIRARQVVVTFQPPTADASYFPTAPRASEAVTFDASASFDFDGTLVGYAWDFDGDGRSDSTDAVTSHVFAAPGHYRVTLTVTDDAGNSDTQILEIDVTSATSAAPTLPAAPLTPTTPPSAAVTRPPIADFAYVPVSPTAGKSVAFDAAASVDFDGAIVRFAWDFDADGETDAEGRTTEWTFASAGSYDVALTVTDAAGMSDTVVYNVEVVGVPGISPAAPRTLSAHFVYAPAVPRAEEVVRFDASASVNPYGGALDYSWDFDGNGTSDGDGPISEWVFPAAGSYPVTLTVLAPGGQSDSLTLSVPVLAPGAAPAGGQPPIAAMQYVPADPRPGDPVMFNATASVDLDGRVLAYAWDFDADGLIDSTEAIAVHAFVQAGTYSVLLTVFDDAGNSDAVSASIVVQ